MADDGASYAESGHEALQGPVSRMQTRSGMQQLRGAASGGSTQAPVGATPMTGVQQGPTRTGRAEGAGGAGLCHTGFGVGMGGLYDRQSTVASTAIPTKFGSSMYSASSAGAMQHIAAERERAPVFTAHQLFLIRHEIRQRVAQEARRRDAIISELRASNEQVRRAQI